MKTFAGRVAVVTGGANGIGLSLARGFLREGMKVVVADINQTDIDRAVADLGSLGEVIGKRTDVSRYEDVEALARATVDAFGHVHILCNNAGVGGFQRFETTSLETWEWILGVDLWGTIYGCKAFLPLLKREDEAHIVNTASMSGFTYTAYHHPYNVAKAGVVALTEGLYREFVQEKCNVGLSVLCPAFVDTRIGDDERNAPAGHIRRIDADPGLEAERQATNRMLTTGKSPDEVALIVIDAIRTGRTHIFTHPEWIDVITTRAGLIERGEPVLTVFSGPLPFKLEE